MEWKSEWGPEMTKPAGDERFVQLLEEHKRILYKIASAYCSDAEDRRDLVQEMVIQLWRSFPRYDDSAAADRVLGEAGDDVRLLQQLISRLDEMSRALVVLYLEGYSHAEIAEILGISVTNVGTRINRIKNRLKEELNAA